MRFTGNVAWLDDEGKERFDPCVIIAANIDEACDKAERLVTEAANKPVIIYTEMYSA